LLKLLAPATAQGGKATRRALVVPKHRASRDALASRSRLRHRLDARSRRFILDDRFGIHGSAANRFTFGVTNVSITSIAFHREIFPDATCPKGSRCASHGPGASDPNHPDIERLLDGNVVRFGQMLASTPADGDPQALGTASLTFPAAALAPTPGRALVPPGAGPRACRQAGAHMMDASGP
jgi:hypothetical protein